MAEFHHVNWKAALAAMGATGIRRDGPDGYRFYLAPSSDSRCGVFLLSDNGGEVNLSEVVPAYTGSVAYRHSIGPHAHRAPGPLTMAQRLFSALNGREPDYQDDLDAE